MSLYGDLPPPSEGAAEDGLEYKHFGTAPFVPIAAETVASTTTSKVNPSVMLKPTNLAFKPRQTKSSISNAPVQSAPKPAPSNITIAPTSLPPPVDTKETKPKENKHPTKISVVFSPGANLNGKDKEKDLSPEDDDDFVNLNTSFEIAEEDAYDPRRPNDYIAYCEERLQQRKAIKLAEENRRILDEQQRANEQLERERREAVLRGDFQRLVATEPTGGGVGRGRGRGSLSNLPSWMTAAASNTSNTSTSLHTDDSGSLSSFFSLVIWLLLCTL